jgi:7-carboxy-7-deazaguanine synthase
VKLKVSEIFCSLQGEGLRVGEPSVFLRLSGCNFRCVHCDTRYSWDSGDDLEIDKIVAKISEYGIKSLIITGGEPTLQAAGLIDLANRLLSLGYSIACETNGSVLGPNVIEFLNSIDLVAVSPKLKSFIGKYIEDYNDVVIDLLRKLRTRFFLKFVITKKDDFGEVLSFLRLCEQNGIKDVEVFLQPNSMLCSSVNEYISFLRQLWGAAIDFQRQLYVEGLSFKVRMIPQLHRLAFWDTKRGV